MQSPFTNQAPYWVWGSLRRTRVGKDCGDWFMRLLNRTGIYEIFFKRSSVMYASATFVGLVTSFLGGRFIDRVWISTNRGYLYKDNIYTYPPEEEDDDE